MNTVLIVQLEDLDDNPPEFEFEEKTRDPLSGCAFANELPKIDKIKIQITLCRLISPDILFRKIRKLRIRKLRNSLEAYEEYLDLL